MQYPIFQIDELLRSVTDELVKTSPRAALSFALTCRSFEEPALSSLWKLQHSLSELLKVLSSCASVNKTTDRGPSAEDWVRLRRYASWMRTLDLRYKPDLTFGPNPTVDTLSLLVSNSPGGLLFPNLEHLTCNIENIPTLSNSFLLFLSPRLQHVTLFTYPHLAHTPPDLLAAVVQVISVLPPSLQHLSMFCGQGKDEPLQNVMCFLVCRFGSLLMRFETCVPLSEPAMLHLIQLPNLSYWRTSQGPPESPPASIFPSLEQLCLDNLEALPWVHLLASNEQDASLNGPTSVARPTNARHMLKSLECPEKTILDSRLLCSIVHFRNLVTLRVRGDCLRGKNCIFRLTDDDTENLTAALPRLKTLLLGYPCTSKTCKTTINSLVSISLNCLDLEELETHFDTQTIAADVRRLLDNHTSREKTKCKRLCVGVLPLDLPSDDVGIVAMGFRVVFPYLTGFTGYTWASCWRQVESNL